MAIDVDALIDRRRMKRRVTFWRIAAVVLLVGLVFAVFSAEGGIQGPRIARVSIADIIVGDPVLEDMLRDLATDDDVKAVVVSIDSPGGTVVGSEVLYKRLRDIAANKPVVAVIGTVGASGGYIAALAADRIFAYENSITGSIGVIFQAPEFSELLSEIGVKVNEVKSAPLKGGPSPFAPMDDQMREQVEAMVDDAFQWFKGLVQDRRHLDEAQLAVVSDGRVFSGRQAVSNGLIDALGGEDEALDWLDEAHGLDPELPVVDAKPQEEFPFMQGVLAWVTGDPHLHNRLSLDGLLALWHPY